LKYKTNIVCCLLGQCPVFNDGILMLIQR